MDVTLACADGSTIDAHKVILSSVSTYFRDILKVGQKILGVAHLLRIKTIFTVSECALQAPHHNSEGHTEGRGSGHAGVCLHWRGNMKLFTGWQSENIYVYFLTLTMITSTWSPFKKCVISLYSVQLSHFVPNFLSSYLWYWTSSRCFLLSSIASQTEYWFLWRL